MMGHPPIFLHRADRDGTFDSICIRCFQTIATEFREAVGAEIEHQCVPSDLTTLAPRVWQN
jgi:hypothetical protein